jgi:hypothetical protein
LCNSDSEVPKGTGATREDLAPEFKGTPRQEGPDQTAAWNLQLLWRCLAQELYEHAVSEHLGLLYPFPDTVRDGKGKCE